MARYVAAMVRYAAETKFGTASPISSRLILPRSSLPFRPAFAMHGYSLKCRKRGDLRT